VVRSPTKPSTLRLSEVARHVVLPSGIISTGWPAVEAKCREWGDTFDEWQRGAGRVILGKREDDIYAATVGGVGLSIPRQVAKTFLVMRIVFALCALFPGMTVLWTAHRTRTATRTFRSMQGFAGRKKVAPYIAHIRTANGEQEIVFTNGSVIMFGAREQGFGRGFDEVDIEVFDEAQILTEKALEDMVAATNQSRHPHGALLFYLGTPPRPTDPGEAFAMRRKEALAGESEDAVWIECSADSNVGRPGGPSLDDRKQLAIANPSYPHRTPERSIQRLRKNLPSDDSWRREGLGVWDEFNAAALVFPLAKWTGLKVDTPPASGSTAFGVKFSFDGARVGLSVALMPDGGGPVYVECLGIANLAEGTTWLVEKLAGQGRRGPVVVVDGKSGSGDFVNTLRAAGVPVRRIMVPTVPDVIDAHAGMLSAVHTGDVQHSGQPGLDASVKTAGKRKIGQLGGWGIEPTTPGGDVLALESAILARHGLTSMKNRSRATGEAVFV